MSSETEPRTRHAVVRGQAAKIETIRRYLPSNYTADHDGGSVWIHGVDVAGWTMHDYGIPRLASGLYRAEEVFIAPPATVPASVLADAERAYDRQDQEWFNALSTETLAAMWALCTDIGTLPSWDDEVYEALYPRGYFESTD